MLKTVETRYPSPAQWVVKYDDAKPNVVTVWPSYYKDLNFGGIVMSIESFQHFMADMNGTVTDAVKRAGSSGNRWVDAVIRGQGIYLGRGDDGVAWRVGPRVVKAASTVPYQPSNQFHRTIEKAKDMMRNQWNIGQRLRKAGVRHLPDTELVDVADTLFEVKPFYHLAKRFNKHQLDQIAETMSDMHLHGYLLGDSVQVGIDGRGDVWFYDIGKIRKGTLPKGKKIWPLDDFTEERRSLEKLYKEHGNAFMPPRGYLLDKAWEDVTQKRPWFSVSEDDLEALHALGLAAKRAGMPNIDREYKIAKDFIVASLAKQQRERQARAKK